MLLWLLKFKKIVKKHTRGLAVFFVLFLVIGFGSISFYYFERGYEQVASLWDAIYWIIVTITTVGFGDITPQTDGGRVVFIIVALSGIGTIAYVIDKIVSFSTEDRFKKIFGLKKLKMKNHSIIVGWNTKTEEAIKELKSANEDFLIVGNKLEQEELNKRNLDYVIGEFTSDETLNRCNIKGAKTLMIPLDNDSEIIMIALLARKLNKKIKISAICNAEEHLDLMREAGIDYAISHTKIGGRLLTHTITEPIVVKFIINATTAQLQGVELKEIIINQDLKLSKLKFKEDERILAIHRNNNFVLKFNSDFNLERGDVLVVLHPTSN